MENFSAIILLIFTLSIVRLILKEFQQNKLGKMSKTDAIIHCIVLTSVTITDRKLWHRKLLISDSFRLEI